MNVQYEHKIRHTYERMYVCMYVHTYVHKTNITIMKMYLNEYLALELLRGRKTASLDLHWGSVQAVCRQQEHIHTYITHSEDKGHTTHTQTGVTTEACWMHCIPSHTITQGRTMNS